MTLERSNVSNCTAVSQTDADMIEVDTAEAMLSEAMQMLKEADAKEAALVQQLQVAHTKTHVVTATTQTSAPAATVEAAVQAFSHTADSEVQCSILEPAAVEAAEHYGK